MDNLLVEWNIVGYNVFTVGESGIFSKNCYTLQNMLIGEYIHALDDKRRVSLPAKFRKEVGKKMIRALVNQP